ncbi:MAG TPA: hypothetical protein VNY32_01300 [Candidatus Acidoferrales bacterium]|jgi:hypothetical protein|nr:hypothetical protein [Candidatus Acidoferrales bacterium]
MAISLADIPIGKMDRRTEPEEHGEIEITEEMIEAGEEIILAEIGGVEGLPGFSPASSLAEAVYRAMRSERKS